jgi:hypothetical protein
MNSDPSDTQNSCALRARSCPIADAALHRVDPALGRLGCRVPILDPDGTHPHAKPTDCWASASRSCSISSPPAPSPGPRGRRWSPRLSARGLRWIALSQVLYGIGTLCGFLTLIYKPDYRARFDLADIFFLAAYPAIMLGLVFMPRVERPSASRSRILVDSAVFLAGVGLPVWLFTLGPGLSNASLFDGDHLCRLPSGDLLGHHDPEPDPPHPGTPALTGRLRAPGVGDLRPVARRPHLPAGQRARADSTGAGRLEQRLERPLGCALHPRRQSASMHEGQCRSPARGRPRPRARCPS